MGYLLVCGGRDYDNYGRVSQVLDAFVKRKWPVGLVVHGGCGGADELAERWAVSRSIHTAVVKAQWDNRKRDAGPLRNTVMAMLLSSINQDRSADVACIAFPGGRGTQNMIRQAKEACIEVFEVT